MKVHHINCGSMCPMAGRWLPSLLPAEVVCHCLVVETENGLVLVDTGLSHRTLLHPRALGAVNALLNIQAEPEKAALEQVKSLGFSTGDVRNILLTHLDDDHAGGIVDFPEAQVHVSHAEMNAARNPFRASEKVRYRHLAEIEKARWQLHAYSGGENWFGFQGVRPFEKNDDFLLIPLMGHSKGHFGVAVRSEEGWLLHAGDAYYDSRELDGRGEERFGMALLQTVVHSDYQAALQNRRRLRELRNNHPEVKIFCAHDKQELETWLR
jgi:glyoxylase-like metal-dependent hydrolase (beta-lactamase superfamily II)